MNAQEIYETVVNHLRQQGERSVGPDGTCLYRSGNGLKCAIGILISDEVYKPEMEEKDLLVLLDQDTINLGPVREELTKHFSMLKEFQKAHDCSYPSNWEEDFKKIAKLFALQYTSPQK